MTRTIDVFNVHDEHPFAAYATFGRKWRDVAAQELLRESHAETLDHAAREILTTAAVELALSRYVTDQGIDYGRVELMQRGSELAAASRASYEAVARLVLEKPPHMKGELPVSVQRTVTR